MATIQKKTVLITGCSTGGIGWAMVKVFQRQGFHVFATVRDPAKAAELAQLSDVEILGLDFTVPETISRAKDVVMRRTGDKLDVLVHNAGASLSAPCWMLTLRRPKSCKMSTYGALLLCFRSLPLF